MNSKQINSDILINEWQLGSQLNTAVHNGTRDKFNLLLSLLSDDARDFAQFSLSRNEQAAAAPADLRAALFLPEAQPLLNKGISPEQAKSLNADLHSKDFTNIRLKQLLSNEALLSRHTQGDFPSEIVDSLSLLAQQRLSAMAVKNEPAAVLSSGVNNDLMEAYKALDLENKPLKVNYM